MYGKLMQGNPEMANVILDLLQVYELHDILFAVALFFILFKVYSVEQSIKKKPKKRRKKNASPRLVKKRHKPTSISNTPGA